LPPGIRAAVAPKGSSLPSIPTKLATWRQGGVNGYIRKGV